MERIWRILQILAKALAFVATIAGAFFGYVEYRNERGEPIAGIVRRISEHVPLSAWHWVVIAICGGAVLLLLGWRNKLKKWAKNPPEVPDDHELVRQLRWHLRLAALFMRRHEFVALDLCSRQSPSCACVHGAAAGLISIKNPFVLLRILVWLQHKLDSDTGKSSPPLHLLRMLVEGLQGQLLTNRLLWPQEFRETFRKCAMDVYGCVARHLVWAVQRCCFIHWQHKHPRRFLKTAMQRFPLEQPKPEDWLEELMHEEQHFIDSVWQLLDLVVSPIERWLDSTDTPLEVEEATLAQVIPTLLALPISSALKYQQMNAALPKLSDFVRRIIPSVWRDTQVHGFEAWLRRLQLVFETEVLIYIMRWLDIQGKQTVIERTWRELVALYEADCDERLQPGDTEQLFAEFDRFMIPLVSGSEFDKTWTQHMIDQVGAFSKRTREANALPIATVCDNVNQKLKVVLEQL